MFNTKYINILKNYLISKQLEPIATEREEETLSKTFSSLTKNKLVFGNSFAFIEFLLLRYLVTEGKNKVLFITSDKKIKKTIDDIYSDIINLISETKVTKPILKEPDYIIENNGNKFEFIISSAYIINKKTKYDLIVYYDYEMLNKEKVRRDILSSNSKVLFVSNTLHQEIEFLNEIE